MGVFMIVAGLPWIFSDSGFVFPYFWSFVMWPIIMIATGYQHVASLRIRVTDYTIGSIHKDTWQSTFLHIDDVVRIEEKPGKGLVVRSCGSARHVDVPEEIEGSAEVRAKLAKWRPIEVVA